MEGAKRKRRCESQCLDHVLQLQAVRGTSRHDIRVVLCPKYQRQPLPPEQTYPVFNNDGKYFTSAFVLGVDRRVLMKNEQQEMSDHQRQIRESLEKHNQLVFPRPNSKHTLCSVCKEQYRHYYTHIYSQSHRDAIANAVNNPLIIQLAARYSHLWQGAQEHADAEEQRRAAEFAERRAAEEERRRILAEQTIQQQEDEEEESSLLDVQRGEQEEPEEEQANDNFTAKPSSRSTRKPPRSIYYEQDTVPLPSRSHKRKAPEVRRTDPELRKKYAINNSIITRQARERDERRYEKERERLRGKTEPKELQPTPNVHGDYFIVMRAPDANGLHPPPYQSKRIAQDRPEREERQERQQEKESGEIEPSEEEENMQDAVSISKTERTGRIDRQQQTKQVERTDKVQKQKEKEKQKVQVDKLQRIQKPKIEKFPYEQDRREKNQRSEHPRYEGKPNPYYYMSNQHPHDYYKNADPHRHHPEAYRPNDPHKQPPPPRTDKDYKAITDAYKIPSYGYYNPYVYNIYDPTYSRNEKNNYDYNSQDKDKPKPTPADYPNNYNWPYSHPYYMPSQPQPHDPANPPSSKPNTNPSNSQYMTNTNININFPMYVCPPPPHHSPYSQPPSRYIPPIIPNYYPYSHYSQERREGEYPPQAHPPHQPHPHPHPNPAQPPLHHPPSTPYPQQGYMHGYPHHYQQHPSHPPTHPAHSTHPTHPTHPPQPPHK